MGTRQQFSRGFKLEALRLDGSVSHAAREALGVSRSGFYAWLSRPRRAFAAHAVVARRGVALALAALQVAAAGAADVVAAAKPVFPAPRAQGSVSLEGALAQRRSLRSFAAAPLSAAEAGQLLWAAQGVTGAQGERNAPSAGATHPLVLYLVAGRIDGLAVGVYRYLPQGHRLQSVSPGDVRAAMATAAHGQRWIADAPALVVIAAQPARTASRYGVRADRFVAIEAGAAAQNLLLQAVALGLGGTLVGAFDEAAVRRSLALDDAEQPLIIVPVGRRR